MCILPVGSSTEIKNAVTLCVIQLILESLVFCYSPYDCAGVSWTTAVYSLDVLLTDYF